MVPHLEDVDVAEPFSERLLHVRVGVAGKHDLDISPRNAEDHRHMIGLGVVSTGERCNHSGIRRVQHFDSEPVHREILAGTSLRPWYAPGSGMSIPNPRDVDFPAHGKSIRAAAKHFELTLDRSLNEAKRAWIHYLRETQGLSLEREQADAIPDIPSLLRSDTIVQAAHIYTNLDAYLQSINQQYQASLQTP